MPRKLTRGEVDRLLAERRVAVLGTRASDGRAMLAPIWYVHRDGKILMRTAQDSLKAAHIRRDPRVTVCVQDERAPYKSVTVYGTAVVAPSEKGLDVRMARRYLGFVGGFFYLQGARRAVEQGATEVTLVVTPERFVTQDFSPETPRVGKLWLLAKRVLPPWL